MKLTKVFIFTFSLSLASASFCQELSQTVRGTVIDIDSKIPLTGVNVIIKDSDPLIGTITDNNGNYRFENLPLGRITLQFSYLGYEPQVIQNIELRSGKEAVIVINLQESVQKIDDVAVKAKKNKGEALNEMAILSARSISVEESKRFAGGFDDPSRVVSNYAGVAATADGSCDIIVRGNAPKYMQWQIEGIESTSPYHFDDQNASYGGLSALNNNLLNTSDFYTGAFAPEYGNVLSGVYDVKIRQGNNEEFEAMAGVGVIGTDLTFEGPFKKDYGGSFLVNYRYSTTSLLNDLGVMNLPGLFNFQDATFKIVLPTKKIGSFSLFGFGGLDDFAVKDDTSSTITKPGDMHFTEKESIDYNKNNYLFNTGLTHVISLSGAGYLKTTLSFSGNSITDEIFRKKSLPIYNQEGVFIRDSVYNRVKTFDNEIKRSTYRGSVTYNLKINARNKIRAGTKYSLYDFKYQQGIATNDSILFSVVDFEKQTSSLQSFISWQFRPTENITIVSGLHNMNVFLNNKYTFEPRIACNWQFNPSNSVHVGYGSHSTMESMHHYFTKINLPDGSYIEPNRDLDLLKGRHYVIGYEKRFARNLVAKVEMYYQDLYNLPVENNDTSYFATINEGLEYHYVDLVNKGTGKNYGIEFTLERFFDKKGYFLINATLFNSKYTTLDEIERNTQFNQNYLLNVLFGKEYSHLGKNNNQVLGLNYKMIFQLEFLFEGEIAPDNKVAVIKEIQDYFNKV